MSPADPAPSPAPDAQAPSSAPSGGESTGLLGALPLGTVVGDFRLEAVLGRPGGQGVVYEATQLSLGRRVALKLLRSSAALTDKRLARFRREAEAGSRISHPGLAVVHAYGEADGLPFLAQELVPGGDLREHLDARRRDGQQADDYRALATLFAELCDALEVAHEAGVIHRDLKPANILLTTDGHPKVVDFGLAKVLDAESLSATGSIEGTPFYMSPEQADVGGDPVDRRSDVFSLGATFYEALTLTRPFEADTLHQLIAKLCRVEPADPRSLRSRIPVELAVIALKALEKRPEDRYPTMAAFGADLRRWLADEPILARPPGPLRRARKWARRHPTASTVLTLALVSSAGFAWLSGQLSERNDALGAALDRETALSSELSSSNQALVEAHAATRAALDEAQAQRVLADVRASEARRERENVLRLSAFQDLEDLRREADALWPVAAEQLDAYDAWLDRAAALVAGLDGELTGPDAVAGAGPAQGTPGGDPSDDVAAATGIGAPAGDASTAGGHRAQLAALRARALPRSEAERQTQRRSHPEFAAWQAKAAEVAAAEQQLAAGRAMVADMELEGDQLAQAERTLDQAAAVLDAERATLAALDARLDEHRAWTFTSADDTWWHNQLVRLIDEIEAFADPDQGLIHGLSPAHGWGVARRRALAADLTERTLAGPEARRRWDEALAGLRDPQRSPPYAGMPLEPQPGLLPLGQDPDSGLWEFWHVLSGDEPARDAEGRLVIEEATGIVLVLIPGGAFPMGAHPRGPAPDPHAQQVETPVHAVRLSPYFLAKYELTQSQWLRLTGTNPSLYDPDVYAYNWNRDNKEWSGTQPVEQISWDEALAVLGRLGLTLPSEAQWEFACRAGTITPWSTGATRETLDGFVNLSDRFGRSQGNEAWSEWEDWLDDGHTTHAPVGSYRPNPFGLHDMHGNVWEWCLDTFADDYYGRSPEVDPVNREEDPARTRVFRGGAYLTNALLARSAFRHYNTADKVNSTLGVRAAGVVVLD